MASVASTVKPPLDAISLWVLIEDGAFISKPYVRLRTIYAGFSIWKIEAVIQSLHPMIPMNLKEHIPSFVYL